MSLVSLLVVLIVLGVVAYLIYAFMPMEPRIKQILLWVILAVAIFVVLQAFGVCDVLKQQPVPHV